MLKLTLFDKLKILFDLMIGSPLFIFIFIFSILTLLILLDLKDKNKNVAKLLIGGIYLVLIIILLVKYHTSVLQTLDYFFDNLFIIFYFPNLAIYVVMIVVSNILMYKNLFLDKKEPIRVVSLCAYTIIMYLMILIIYTVGVEGLDVYEETSIYSSNNMITLVELSNIVFVLWIIALLTDRLLYLLENKQLVVTNRSKKRVITKVVEKPIIEKYPIEIPVEKEIIKEIPIEREIVKEVKVEVPVEKEIIKEVKVEVPVEKDVIKEVKVEVPVEKDVIKEVKVEVPVEKEVIKEVKVEVPVEKDVIKEVIVPVEKEVVKEVKVEVPVPVEKEVIKEIRIPVPVEKEVIKEVKVPVEKEVIKEVKVPIEKEIIKEVKIEVPVEKIVYKEKNNDMFTKEDYIIMSEILKRVQKDMIK